MKKLLLFVSACLFSFAATAQEEAYVDPTLGTLTSLWGENTVVGKTMTFVSSDSGIGFAEYNTGFDLSAYKTITITMTEIPSWVSYIQAIAVYNNDDNKSFSFVGTTATIKTADLDFTTLKQLYIQCGGTGDITLESIVFSTEEGDGGDTDTDAAYVDPVLGTLTSLWGDNTIAGKTMTFVTGGSGIGFAEYNTGFDLSAYKTITITMTEIPSWVEYIQVATIYNNDDNKSFPFVGTTATIKTADLDFTTLKQLYIQCGGTGDITLESIVFSTEGTETAINTVESAAFAVEGGMVASAGQIVVYNVAGQVVATASQNFNVNSLAKGVYFITAQEGIIKFVK